MSKRAPAFMGMANSWEALGLRAGHCQSSPCPLSVSPSNPCPTLVGDNKPKVGELAYRGRILGQKEKELKAAPIGKGNYPSAAAEIKLGPSSLSHQDIVVFAN